MTDRAKELTVGIIAIVIMLATLALVFESFGCSPVLSSPKVLEERPMKSLLFAALLAATPVAAQDSVVLAPKYFFSTRSGEIDPRMIHDPYASTYNNEGDSWLAGIVQDAYFYGPQVIWEESPNTDSIAIYVGCDDTVCVSIFVGQVQNVTNIVKDLRGPLPFTRYVIPFKGQTIVGLIVPAYNPYRAGELNEAGAHINFGRVTAYRSREAGVRNFRIAQNETPRYLDVLGRPVTYSNQPIKPLGNNTFLVIQ